MKLMQHKAIDGNGSVVMETAILMPMILLILLLFVRLLQIICAQNCVEQAMFRTAELFRKYAILYHQYGVASVENHLLEEIGTLADSGESEILDSFIDLRGYTEEANDALYISAAEILVNHMLQQDPMVQNGYVQVSEVSCAGSDFFDGNDEIALCVRCKVYGIVQVGTSVRFRAWVRGDSPMVSLSESGVSVWSFNNFTRGRMLRDIFGGELPYDYPTIASFKDGEALMIKSIDFTKSTYQDAQRFAKEVREMIDHLAAFKGTEGMTSVEESLWISEDEIQTRKLLLILPSNEMTQEQSDALLNVVTLDASLENVLVEIQRYQVSAAKDA